MRLGGRVVGVLAGDGVVGADYFDRFAVAGCSVVGGEESRVSFGEVSLFVFEVRLGLRCGELRYLAMGRKGVYGAHLMATVM